MRRSTTILLFCNPFSYTITTSCTFYTVQHLQWKMELSVMWFGQENNGFCQWIFSGGTTEDPGWLSMPFGTSPLFSAGPTAFFRIERGDRGHHMWRCTNKDLLYFYSSLHQSLYSTVYFCLVFPQLFCCTSIISYLVQYEPAVMW